MQPGILLSNLNRFLWLFIVGFALNQCCLAQGSNRSVPSGFFPSVDGARNANEMLSRAFDLELGQKPRRAAARTDPKLYDREADEQKIHPFGEITKLILMVRFRNHRDRDLPGRSDYEAIFNREGGHPEFAPAGSALDFSREISYQQMSIHSLIVGWIDLPEDEQYYANGVAGTGDGNRMNEAVTFALNYVDENGLVDFRLLDRSGNRDGYADLVGFVHSGYGAEWPTDDADGVAPVDRIWSHQWRIPRWTSRRSGIRVARYAFSSGLNGATGSKPCRVGLLAHETSHLGDLPDLYDDTGTGIGAWGLMGYSEGFARSGYRPSHMSAWSKVALNWVKPIDLKQSGTYTIRQSETYPEVYRITDGFPDKEYLLIENRQPVGFDSDLPDGKGGLAIWHIDENKLENNQPGFPGQPGWPHNGFHYRVALIQADGKFELEQGFNFGDSGDLFRGGGVDQIDSSKAGGLRPYIIDEKQQIYRRISQISAPGEVMSFRYEVRKDTDVPTGSIGSRTGSTRANESAGQTAPEVRPIVGATVSSASFTHLDGMQLSGDGVLLKATITLKDECAVYIRANTSLKAVGDCGVVTTGFNDGGQSETAMWKESVRIVTTRPDREYVNVEASTRRRLPAGTHTIRWVIRSNGTLQFHSGGVLAVQAYPCPPSSAESRSKGLASTLGLTDS